MPLYYRCKTCGSEHLSPIIFPDKRSYVSSHLKQNVFFCPARGSAARYASADLFWRNDLPPLPGETESVSTIGPPSDDGGRILVVDAVEASLQATESLLEEAGYREIAALTDSRRATDLFRSFQPDLLILELEMPGLDGVGVMQALAPIIAGELCAPTLVITGGTDEEMQSRVLQAGATDILSRPFRPAELLLRVRLLLSLGSLHEKLQGQERLIERLQREEGRRREEARVGVG